MKPTHKAMGIALLIMAVTFLFWVGDASAVHKSGTFRCDGCHSMHGTTTFDGSASTTYGKLLKANLGANFCLQCHDEGTDKNSSGETVPFVVKSTTATTAKPSTVGAGGFFYGMTSLPTPASPYNNGNAHDLDGNEAPPTSNGSGSTINSFYCSDCHDQHGTGASDSTSVDSFRNILKDPSGAGNTTVNLSGNETGYANTDYISGFATFCLDCHTGFDGGNYHPVDKTIGMGRNYEYGMDDTSSDTGQPIIKPEDPGDDDDRTNATAANRDLGNDDEVTCISCHYAHGGPYANLLRWDHGNGSYTWSDPNSDTVGATPTGDAQAGCQICHNK